MTSPSTQPRWRRHRALGLSLGALGAVVLIVLGLSRLGALPIFPAAPVGPRTTLTFGEAQALASPPAEAFSPSNWTLLFASGLASPVSSTYPPPLSVGQNCTLVAPQPGALTARVLPATAGSAPAGAAASWAFVFENDTGALLVVTVLDGHAQLFALATGENCSVGLERYGLVPSDVIDSSAAASAANVAGGAAFLSSHPGTEVFYQVVGAYFSGTQYLPPRWSILYSTCSANASSGAAAEFNATVGASSGVLVAAMSGSGRCSPQVLQWLSPTLDAPGAGTGGSSLAGALSLGPLVPSMGGGWYWYNASISNVGAAVVVGDLSPSVIQPDTSAATLAPGTFLGLVNASGCWVATYDFGTASWSVPGIQACSGGPLGAAAPLEMGEHLSLRSALALGGDTIVLTGLAPFTGTIKLPIA